MTATRPHRLLQYPERLAVVRLAAGAEVPAWAGTATLLSISASAHETSVVCGWGDVPKKVRPAGPYTAFSVEGPLDLEETGILAGLLAPLAEAKVPVFAVSTYDTDWILVPTPRADDAIEAWRSGGREIVPATPVTPPKAGR